MKITNAEIYTLMEVVQDYDPPYVNFYSKDRTLEYGDIHTDILVFDNARTQHDIFQCAAKHGIIHDFEKDIAHMHSLYERFPEHMKKRLLAEITGNG